MVPAPAAGAVTVKTYVWGGGGGGVPMPEPPPQAARNRTDGADKKVPQNLSVDFTRESPPSGQTWMKAGQRWLFATAGGYRLPYPRQKRFQVHENNRNAPWLPCSQHDRRPLRMRQELPRA